MITLAGTMAVSVAFLRLLRVNRAAALASFFLLFPLLTRTAALTYVDIAGPIYAVELERDVGGGPSMPLFASSVLAYIVPLIFLFRPSRLSVLLRTTPTKSVASPRLVNNAVFALVLLFIIALYVDMIWRGTIPIFQGIDRLDYNRGMAGPIHPYIFKYGFLLAVTLGVMMVRPRVKGKEFDFRFLFIYFVVIFYYVLTGNRFSIFFVFTGFFVIPMAAIPMLAQLGYLPPAPKKRNWVVRVLVARSTMLAAISLLTITLAGLITHSLTTVRDYDDPTEQFFQRSIVQPVELWWTTWESMDGQSKYVEQAWDDTFHNPLDPTRNTSIQFLMIKNLGQSRAEELLENGQQYAGGYPEILFELFSPSIALMIALVFGIVTAGLLRLVVLSAAQGHILSAILATYVYYGFCLLYIGGMLNFLLTWSFWVKCGAVFVAAYIENNKTLRLFQYKLSSRFRI